MCLPREAKFEVAAKSKPGRAASGDTSCTGPLIRDSQTPQAERTHVCCWTPTAYGIVLWQPEQINTASHTQWSKASQRKANESIVAVWVKSHRNYLWGTDIWVQKWIKGWFEGADIWAANWITRWCGEDELWNTRPLRQDKLGMLWE